MDPSHKARLLDMEVIEMLKALGGDDEPGLFVELVDLFLEDARGNFEALSDALERADPEALEHTAHALKSSCGNVGARTLSKTCFQLEQLGRARHLGGAAGLLEAALEEFEQVCLALISEKS